MWNPHWYLSGLRTISTLPDYEGCSALLADAKQASPATWHKKKYSGRRCALVPDWSRTSAGDSRLVSHWFRTNSAPIHAIKYTNAYRSFIHTTQALRFVPHWLRTVALSQNRAATQKHSALVFRTGTSLENHPIVWKKHSRTGSALASAKVCYLLFRSWSAGQSISQNTNTLDAPKQATTCYQLHAPKTLCFVCFSHFAVFEALTQALGPWVPQILTCLNILKNN